MSKLVWYEQSPESFSAITPEEHQYFVDVYHHGSQIVVTANDPEGENILHDDKAGSIAAAMQRAQRHYDSLRA